jgi:predicted TPR repeat methyltransferase
MPLQQAIEYLKTNRIQEARVILERITASGTADAETWFLLGATHGMLGNPENAERCSREAVKLGPDFMPAWHNLGKALNDQNRFEEAITVFRRVLQKQPQDITSLTGLAHALTQRGDINEAFDVCKNAIDIAPDNIDTLITMGNLLQRQGKFDQALGWYQRALAFNPNSFQISANISLALKALGRLDEAAAAANQALALAPHSASLHYALGMILIMQHKHDGAASHLYEAFRLNPDHKETGLQLGAVLRHQGKIAEAVEIYQQMLQKFPDDENVRFYLAALQQGGTAPTQLPTELLRKIYDQQETADSFDQALVNKLDYRLPQRLGRVVWELMEDADTKLDILDLGCGTGLYGEELRPLARSLSGVDLSTKMIEKARGKGVYDTLTVADLTSFLDSCQQQYDLITAMDVLMFFGNLEKIFERCAAILRPQGIFAFDVEKLEGDLPWKFHPYGHFKHAARYVRELAVKSNLREIHFEETIIRKEANEPQTGYLCLFRKP